MNVLIVIAGITLLLAGGEALVRGAVGIARRSGISPFLIGLTIVGFGTSAPELVVSVDAALTGSPGIALGNVIGSNLANIMLIVGAAALIRPLGVHPDALRRDSFVMVAATLVLAVIALEGTLTRLYGAAFLVAALAYILLSLWWDMRGPSPAATLHSDEATEIDVGLPDRLWILLIAVGLGLAALVTGARLTVTGAIALARQADIPEEVIGITLVAVGTSLPELVTSMVAARRGHADVCVGNILGSNVFNILAIAGAAAVAAPLPFSGGRLVVDAWILVGVTLIFVVFMMTGRRVVRAEGFALLVLYISFIALHVLASPALLPGTP